MKNSGERSSEVSPLAEQLDACEGRTRTVLVNNLGVRSNRHKYQLVQMQGDGSEEVVHAATLAFKLLEMNRGAKMLVLDKAVLWENKDGVPIGVIGWSTWLRHLNTLQTQSAEHKITDNGKQRNCLCGRSRILLHQQVECLPWFCIDRIDLGL